jgi:predicted O-methyltransferase YrrM
MHNTADIAAKLKMFRGYSQDQIPKLADNSIDFAFIDGDHSAKQVHLDAKLLLPKMKPNGIILFDDYLFLQEFQDRIQVEFKGRYVIARVQRSTINNNIAQHQ